MSRAIIMSVEAGKAVVLTPDGRFLRVSEKIGYAVGDEVEIDPSELASPARRRSFARSGWIASATSAAIVVLTIFAIWTFRTPPVVAYVSMDVNPSVEMGLDSKERVRELRALNADAVPIVQAVSYKGEKIEEVAAALASALAERDLLAANGTEIVLASVPVRSVATSWEDDVTAKMTQAIEEAAGSPASGALVTAVSVPREVREEAEAHGLSAGKMAFWLKAESQGHDLSLETLRQTALKDIASSWGGVKAVMEDGASNGSTSKEAWKTLLEQAQETKADKLKETKVPASSQANGKGNGKSGAQATPSPSREVQAQTKDRTHGKDGKRDKRDRDNRDKRHDGKNKGSHGKDKTQWNEEDVRRWLNGWSRQSGLWAQQDWSEIIRSPFSFGNAATLAVKTPGGDQKVGSGQNAKGGENGRSSGKDAGRHTGKSGTGGGSGKNGSNKNGNNNKNENGKKNENNNKNEKNKKNESVGKNGSNGNGNQKDSRDENNKNNNNKGQSGAGNKSSGDGDRGKGNGESLNDSEKGKDGSRKQTENSSQSQGQNQQNGKAEKR
ncbi:anti-sigma factor domain-containing protein [Cohnella sp. REN36]|uniref:anti-sigma factor domain-containing protein n=1 Tax=Cohnella sp. REN36 TaxID=2887347 RepID=UPI001D13B3F7|nr:anti-sigma factor domain-containing protein [Cohnella sp. REN36]MCC3374948.1 anti-sigma factor domain-containing protein [Cohnella sp. REN36]